MFIHKANIVCPCVHTCWKHFRWFGVLAIKQWVISVLDVFVVTTTRYRLLCRCVSLWTYIHYQRATSFQYNPMASHLRLLPEYYRLHSYVSLSKKQCFCLSLLDLKSDWLPGFLLKFYLGLFWRWFSLNSRWNIIVLNWHEHLHWYNKSLNELWWAGY